MCLTVKVIRFRWNKYLSQSGTQFSLAARRYSSRGYRTFNDHVWANNKIDTIEKTTQAGDIANYYQYDFGRKNSFSLNINQVITGKLGVSGDQRSMAEITGNVADRKNYQLSYTNSWERLSYTLSVVDLR